MKKVSVIMASYNGEKYIKEQIDSILNQKDVIVNLLIRDDGSTDSTQSILDDYQEKGLLTWYKDTHINVAKGFMELLRKCEEADYYAFCDQDDIWLEDKLSAAANMLDKENPELPLMYYCSTTLVDTNLNFIAEHSIHQNRTDLARFIFNDMSGNTIVLNNKLRELLNLYSDLDITIHDKWALQVCLATGGKCISDNTSHILYRQHGNNTIGMELKLSDKINKFKRIVNLPMDKHLRILSEKYSDYLVSPYQEIIKKCNVNKKMKLGDRYNIVSNKEINFDNVFYQAAFVIHVLKGNL